MTKINKDAILNYFNEIVPDAKCELDFNNDYELLIAVVLSAQATDKSVNRATPSLFAKYQDFNALAKAKVEDVENIIKSLGLSKIKAKRIIDIANTIVNKFNGVIPNDFDTLTSINGIGRKTANVILIELYHIKAFPVDTHINRLAHRFAIASFKDDIVKVEKKLAKFFEGEDFHKLHHQLIAFGRYYCTAKNPKCAECKLKCSKKSATF